MMYWGNGMGVWGMAFMALANLLLWALVIAGVVVLVRNFGRHILPGGPARSGPTDGGRTARQILDERFARGEIDEDEYYRRRQVLDGQASGHPAG